MEAARVVLAAAATRTTAPSTPTRAAAAVLGGHVVDGLDRVRQVGREGPRAEDGLVEEARRAVGARAAVVARKVPMDIPRARTVVGAAIGPRWEWRCCTEAPKARGRANEVSAEEHPVRAAALCALLAAHDLVRAEHPAEVLGGEGARVARVAAAAPRARPAPRLRPERVVPVRRHARDARAKRATAQ